MNKKITMPEGIIAQQIEVGDRENSLLLFLKSSLRLIKKKELRKLYNEFKKDVVEKGGGNHRTGWKSKGIYDVVNEWQPAVQ